MSKPLVDIDFSVFRKTDNEKVMVKRAKRIYKTGMKSIYGSNWKTSGNMNIPVKFLDKNKF